MECFCELIDGCLQGCRPVLDPRHRIVVDSAMPAIAEARRYGLRGVRETPSRHIHRHCTTCVVHTAPRLPETSVVTKVGSDRLGNLVDSGTRLQPRQLRQRIIIRSLSQEATHLRDETFRTYQQCPRRAGKRRWRRLRGARLYEPSIRPNSPSTRV